MPADVLRCCGRCLQCRPLDQFRRRSRTGEARLHECRACHNEAERQRRASRRTGIVGRTMRRVRSATTIEQATRIFDATVEQLGGAHQLAAALVDHGRQAIPGSRIASDFYLGMLQLMALCHPQQPVPRDDDYDQFTDEELDAEIDAALDRLLTHHQRS